MNEQMGDNVYDNRTALKKQAFLEALREKYSVYHAAKAADVARSTVYKWRDEDEAFANAWDEAQEDAVDELEQSLYERAKEKDTVAAIFLLKGARPDKYKDRVASEISGKLETSQQILPATEVDRRIKEFQERQQH